MKQSNTSPHWSNPIEESNRELAEEVELTDAISDALDSGFETKSKRREKVDPTGAPWASLTIQEKLNAKKRGYNKASWDSMSEEERKQQKECL